MNIEEIRDKANAYDRLLFYLDPIVITKDRTLSVEKTNIFHGDSFLLHRIVQSEIKRMRPGERRYLQIPTFKAV